MARGKPKKAEPIVNWRELSTWPDGTKSTAAENRVLGTYRLKSTDPRQKPAKRAYDVLKSFFKKVDIKYGAIHWFAKSDKDAVDQEFENPGVIVTYQWQNEQRTVAVDRFTTPVANLRACTESVQAIYMLWRAGSFTDLDDAMARYSGGLQKAGRPPAKAHLDPKFDFLEILEIPDCMVDAKFGMPRSKDKKWLQRQRIKLADLYHPDKYPDCDLSEDFKTINATYDFLLDHIATLEKTEEQQAETKKRAAEEAQIRAERAAAEAQIRVNLRTKLHENIKKEEREDLKGIGLYDDDEEADENENQVFG